MSSENSIDTATPSYLISHSIDSLCYEIIMKPKDREINSMIENLLQKIDNHKMVKFGRIQCSIALANLIQKIHKFSPDHEYSHDNMEHWETRNWNEFVQDFHCLKAIICRRDAIIFIPAPLKGYKNCKTTLDLEKLRDERINDSIVSNALFNHKFDEILNMCHFQWALSYVRIPVLKALHVSKGTKLEVSDAKVKELLDFIIANFDEGDQYYDTLMTLFTEHTSNQRRKRTNNKNITHQLKDLKELDLIIKKKCPTLDRLRKIAERLLQNWYTYVFDAPIFVSAGLTTSYNEDSKKSQVDDHLPPYFESPCKEGVAEDEGFLPQNDDDDDDNYDNKENESIPTYKTSQEKDEPPTPGKRKRIKTKRLIDELSAEEQMASRNNLSPKKSYPNKKQRVFDVQEISPFETLSQISAAAASNRSNTQSILHTPTSALNQARAEQIDNDKEEVIKTSQNQSKTSSNKKKRKESIETSIRVKQKKKRIPWSYEEKKAVKDGFKEYGHDWVKIKEVHRGVLENRTNIQIKDCFRTMLKNDEI